MATEIGALVVRIGADADDLLSDLKKLDSGFGSMGKNIKLAHDAVRAFAAAAAAAAASLAALIAVASKGAEEIYKAAQSAGVATQTFSELAYAAGLSGVSTEALSTSINKLNHNVAQAAQQTGEAYGAFKALNLEVRNTDGSLKSADQVMAAVANKFVDMEDGAGKSALAIAIFGRAGAQLIPMLNQGGQGLAALREEARQLGVTIDSQTGKAAEQFRDNIQRLHMAGTGLANQLMAEMLPTLNNVTDALVNAARASGSLRGDIEGMARFIESAALTVFETFTVVASDVAFTFKMIGGEIGVIGAQLAALARLDVQGFKLIGEDWRRDSAQARVDLDAFQKRVMDFRRTVRDNAAGGAMDMGIGLDEMFKKKRQAPTIEDPKAMAAREEAVRDAIHRAREKDDARELAQIEYKNKQMEVLAEHLLKSQEDLNDKIAKQVITPTMDDDTVDPARNARFIAISEGLKSEEELENQAHVRRIAQLQDFTDQELEQIGGRQAVEQQMEQEHQYKLLQIRSQGLNTLSAFQKASFQQQAKTIFEELANITAGVSQHNRTLFEINKVAGIANAIIHAYEGIALTMSKYPYPLNIGMAALHAAAAFAQVSSIASTSYGSNSAPSIAGSTAATPVTPVDSGTSRSHNPDTIIHLHGEVFGRETIRAMFDQFNEEARDGGRIVVAG